MQKHIFEFQEDSCKKFTPLRDSYYPKTQISDLYRLPEPKLTSRRARLGMFGVMALFGFAYRDKIINSVVDAVAGDPPRLTWMFSAEIARQPISNIGLYAPRPLLAGEISKIEQFELARTKYLNWQKDLDFNGLSIDTANILDSSSAADHAILHNMRPDDLAGMFKEQRGIHIISRKGVPYNHIEEVQGASRAIKNTILRINNRVIELQKIELCNALEVKLLLEKALKLLEIEKLYCDLKNNFAGANNKKNIKHKH